MNLEQVRRRTAALQIPKEIYELYDQLVKKSWAAKQRLKFWVLEVSPHRGLRKELRIPEVSSPRDSKKKEKELHKMIQKKKFRALFPWLLCCMPCFAAASDLESAGGSPELLSIDQSSDPPFRPHKKHKQDATAMAQCVRFLGHWTSHT